MANFRKDLAAGKVSEKRVLATLKQKYRKKHQRNCKVWFNETPDIDTLRKWDIEDEFGNTWEVKRDRMWMRTGNIFLEHIGLNHSQAKYVVYCLDGDACYFVKRESLLEAMSNPKYRVVEQGFGTDNFGTLFPVAELKQISKKL